MPPDHGRNSANELLHQLPPHAHAAV
jgi:hypothetical protein